VLKCQACGKGFEEVVESCLKCGSSDLKAPPYLVRRALVPSPGFIFIMPDYDQMEYRMMFDYACREVGYETNIVKAIKAGLDPHQAMADTVTATGHPLTRSRAKNANFAKLYGSGIKTFAWTAGCTERDARGIMHAIDQAAPEIETFVSNVMRTAQTRRYIFNWAGRQYVFPNPRWAYRGPNYLIQGGCADTMKYAMNYINHLLKGNKFKSRMVVTVHDELLIECWHTEVALAPGMVKEIMESIFPWKYLPLTAAMEWSEKSFADKIKGMPA
jgi:DNA polymerase-1